MTKTPIHSSKTVERWRQGANEGGVSIPRRSPLNNYALLADLGGEKLPAPMAKALDAAFHAIEHNTAAKRLRASASAKVENETRRQAEADTAAAFKAARAGDFAKVADLAPDTIGPARAELAKATRVAKACELVEKVAARDLVEESKSPEFRAVLAKVWAAKVATPYTGDSLSEANAHESAASMLRQIVTTLAIATDPDATDALAEKHLRRALRESTSPEMPTVALLREGWGAERKAAEEAAAAKAEADKVANIESAAEAARYRNPARTEEASK